ncbi:MULTISPECIES: HutD family protein [unclassified Rhodococcus (in: high G+C Gram-positive bacteria)]|uniref:HutD/Ves family protein n=1 Tax=unclassified Rhodococcus (in: high G+C Gram-positive bacteria) TaxID=192944 RepID=UPI00163A47E4|nr:MULTISPECIES: HutD family protein [unclassified Rhodococcus (in: high G+C Gram-positive bacteria)]MBC2640313.1 HutD family protein [Rhodococcus sp. 3A]MBC2894941.1 HutD family protein [Rhodococcus sp. 4CII]
MYTVREARIIRRADRHTTRWANGAGTTAEIATGAATRWRVSVATLDGRSAFSSFPGVDRIFTVIGDHPVMLDFGGAPTVIPRLSPTPFAGENGPVCAASGATEAFNVMIDRSTTAASVDVVEIGIAHEVAAGDRVAVLVLVLHGRLATDLGPVGPGDCLLVERGSVHLSGPAAVVVTEILDRT